MKMKYLGPYRKSNKGDQLENKGYDSEENRDIQSAPSRKCKKI